MKRSNPLSCLLTALLLCLSQAAWADKGSATDAAFAALLSMPSAKPANGSWDFPEPDGFEAGSEGTLIAYLARQHKAGADLNAYRHQGTLLHHAIRANLPKVAVWLLERGADPRLTLTGSSEDALALSLSLKRKPLAALLQQKYGMTPAAIAPATTASPPRTAAEREADSVTTAIFQHAKNPAALEQALTALPRATLERHAAAALATLAGVSESKLNRAGKREYTTPATSWRVLWSLLGKQNVYDDTAGVAARMPPELWPELFASGYPNASAEQALGCLLADMSADDLKALWPQLLMHFPDIRQAAPRMVLSHYRMFGSKHCYTWDENHLRGKLQWLTTAGVRAPVTGLSAVALQGISPALKAAMQPYLPLPSSTKAGTKAGQPRFVDAPSKCTFALTDAWLSALLRKEGWQPVTVELLPLPGAGDCALLVGGNERSTDPLLFALTDGFNGPEQLRAPSCLEPDDVYEIWRNVDGKIVRQPAPLGGDNSEPILPLVRDAITGRRYYLNMGGPPGTCQAGARLPYLYEWRDGRLIQDKTPALENALYQQCRQPEHHTIECPGIAAMTSEPQVTAPRPNGFNGPPLERFLRQYGADRYRQYQTAVLALDRDRLKVLQAAGIPGAWTADALQAVAASAMPLADKRKRIAALFYDHAQLRRALDGRWLLGLPGWLPYEDWTPVLKIISQAREHDSLFDQLREVVQTRGMNRLGCDIDHARGRLCGETIAAD